MDKSLNKKIVIRVATSTDIEYAFHITEEMASSAKARGTGIAKRSPEYVQKKMEEGKSVIALTTDGQWVGFCYIEAWGHDKFVANSGLIVSPEFRGMGVAKEIKRKIFELSREKYPDSKIFGLTTGLAVMKINSELGYEPVTYSELTDDEEFWKGCRSCVNFDVLQSKNRQNCLCTAMLYDASAKDSIQPVSAKEVIDDQEHMKEFKGNFKLYERWLKFKKYVLLKGRKKEKGSGKKFLFF